jgi:hypothetical protein
MTSHLATFFSVGIEGLLVTHWIISWGAQGGSQVLGPLTHFKGPIRSIHGLFQ